MRSSNPVFSRRGFSRDNGYAGFNARAAGRGTRCRHAGPTRTRSPGAATPTRRTLTPSRTSSTAPRRRPRPPTGRMTMDDVVMRTGMTLGTVIVTATLAWPLLPVDAPTSASRTASPSAPRWSRWCWRWCSRSSARPSPALILGVRRLRGRLPRRHQPGRTTASARRAPCRPCSAPWRSSPPCSSRTRRGWIRVNRRFYGFVMAAAIGFVLLMVVNLLFAVFGGGDGLGFRSGGLGIVFGIVGIVLGALLPRPGLQAGRGRHRLRRAARGGLAGRLRPDADAGVDLHGVAAADRRSSAERLSAADRPRRRATAPVTRPRRARGITVPGPFAVAWMPVGPG